MRVMMGLLVVVASSCNKSAVMPPLASELNDKTLTTAGILPIKNVWLHAPAIPGKPRSDAFAFTIGKKSYVGGGRSFTANFYNSLKDFWEFDPATNAWTQKADLPGLSTEGAASFVIGNKGYITSGYHFYTVLGGPIDSSQLSRYLPDTWEYDPATDKWSKKANFPGIPRAGAVAMAVNGKAYVGTGQGDILLNGQAISVLFNDWWEFDPSSNQWKKKTLFPGAKRTGAVAAAGNTTGYIGTGSNGNNTYYNDWWEYNPTTDSWAQRANMAGGTRSKAVSISVNNNVYVGTGENHNNPSVWFTDLWQYDAAGNTWIQKQSMSYGRSAAVGFVVNNTFYLGTGGDPNSPYTQDFWKLKVQ